jgi:hypothetical protein
MNLTPRQIDAYVALNEQIDSAERAVNLMINATAAQGDQKAIDKMVTQLMTGQWR